MALLKASAVLAVCLLSLQAVAQAPQPGAIPPPTVPLDPAVQQSPGAQQEAFRAYQTCVGEHRREVDLHNASKAIVQNRDNRARLEAYLQTDAAARARAPRGVDGILEDAFAHYKSFGGTAASIADVVEVPTPCPPPRPAFPARGTTGGSSASTVRQSVSIPRSTLPPIVVPKDPPPTFTPVASPPLRRALEQAWLAHVIAVGTRNEADLQKTMSSYYFAATRNRMARGGALSAEQIALYGKFFPDLNRTPFVTMLEQGPTAALVYSSDAEQPGSKDPRMNYHFLRFSDEGRGWKVDGHAIVNSPKYRADGSREPFKLPNTPDYRIDGQIRPAPAPVSATR